VNGCSRAPTTAVQPRGSENTSLPSATVALSSWLNVVAFGLVQPHGYALINSEWASTMTVGVCGSPVECNVSPNSAARGPSGTKSVRSTVSPFAPGRFMRA
jgi:hypothetical protein